MKSKLSAKPIAGAKAAPYFPQTDAEWKALKAAAPQGREPSAQELADLDEGVLLPGGLSLAERRAAIAAHQVERGAAIGVNGGRARCRRRCRRRYACGRPCWRPGGPVGRAGRGAWRRAWPNTLLRREPRSANAWIRPLFGWSSGRLVAYRLTSSLHTATRGYRGRDLERLTIPQNRP